jgi:hypothetical protein
MNEHMTSVDVAGRSRRALRFAASATALLASILATVPAHAGLHQPDNTPIPGAPGCNGGKTTGLGAIFSCVCTQPGVCNQGQPCPGGSTMCDPGTNGTCETTTWHNVNDNSCIPSNLSGLDPVNDAQITPETFHPTCAQTFTVLSRGTAIFKNAFGWYNATGQKPAFSDLHVMLDCNAAPGAMAVLDLQSEPAYQGGDVGFFLITPESHTNGVTCANGDCCATVARVMNGEGYAFFSEHAYNPDFMGSSSWIHLLEYQSKIFPARYYFAWEDSNFSISTDFTDLVTAVSGIQCSGAGLPCDTGKKGVCASGITVCKMGMVSCNQVFQAGSEACNGLDDDCDGNVDNGATCPDPGKVCYQGQCVPPCTGGEFPCMPNTTCDPKSGLCIEDGCLGVTCAAGQVCHGGTCSAPCQGVVCPHGQTCSADVCLNLCKGVSCPMGQTCREGQCFPSCTQCDGVSCAAPTPKCDATSGTCVDPSCSAPCLAGTFCSNGQCQDACSGAKCPNGQICTNGNCQAAPAVSGSSGGLGFGGSTASSSSSGQASSGGGGGTDTTKASPSACGCRTVGSSPGGLAVLAIVAGAAFAARRPRRRPSR